ncbi:unnamed protein product [Polarella glacialis]|uniref:Uncharacterized protein n=1 Tax=Polarella glacialis TaxID=89957 RepID=A0A813DJG2_POLGL|nr:unnamed protein product [Polarella glacialis]CAE8645135.1 unnamed protein product [Polarella glacialis]
MRKKSSRMWKRSRIPSPLRRKAPDVTIAFQQLKFIVKDNRKGLPPVVNASLLQNEELKWATQWTSTKDWMQDFVNAAVRPLNPSNWPSDAGQPSSLKFQVALSGTCSLPPDLLTRATESNLGLAGSHPSNQVARRLEIGRLQLLPLKHHAVRSSLHGAFRSEEESSRHQSAKSKEGTSRRPSQRRVGFSRASQLAAEILQSATRESEHSATASSTGAIQSRGHVSL